MESLSRQLHRKKLPSANSTGSAAGYDARNGYDGVFAGGRGAQRFGGAQPRHASRIEDYGEIFGGSRGSSIPILDVSALGEARVSASKLDYSAIFEGFRDGGDLGASYEEMFAKPNGARNFSAGARAPAKKVSHSDGTDQLDRYRDEAFQNEAPNQSFAGLKQFNMSYHKSSQKSNNGKNGTTRITQLRAVPGFTCFIEENPPVQKKEGDKYGPPTKVDVTSPTKIYSNAAYSHSSDATGIFESQSSKYELYSSSVDKSFGANEPNTHSSKMSSPSGVSANLTSNKSVPTRSIDLNSKGPKSDASQAGPGYCSPSFSDEELDVNSAAAASAAALRKALETAQASIRIAKEFMERKKDSTQRFSKPSSKDGLDTNNRRDDKFAVGETRFREKNAKEMSEYDDIVFQVFSKSEREKARRSGKVAPDSKQVEEISLIKEVARDTNGNKFVSAEACGAVRQISGMATRGECRTAPLSCEHAGSRNSIIEAVDTHECWRKEMETEKEILEQLDGSGKKVDEEARELEDLEVKLNTIKETRVLDQHGDRLDAVQEVQEQEDNDKPGVARVDEETGEEEKASKAPEKCENEFEEFLEPKENEEFQSMGDRESDDEEGLDEGRECMENEKNLEDIFVEVQDEKLEEFFDLKENEDFESQGVTADNNEEGLDEAQECMENERKLEEIIGEEQNEKLLEEFLDVEENEEFQSQGVKANTNEGLDEAQACMGNERKYEDILGEEQNEKLLEEFMDLKEDEEFESEPQGVKANNNEVGLDEPLRCMENERKLEDIFEEEQNEIQLEEFLGLKENEEFDSQGVKVNNNEEGQDEAQGCMENEKKLKDVLDEEQNKKLLNDIHEEESGHGLRKSCEQNKFDEGLEASGLWGGYEEAFEAESIEKKQHDAHEGNDNERSSDKSRDLDISNKSFNDILVDEDEDTESIQRETEGNETMEVYKEAVEETMNLDATIDACNDGEECEEKQEDDSDLGGMDILVDENEDTESIQRETEGNETMEVYQEAVEETMNFDAPVNDCKSAVGESEEVHRDIKDDYDLSFEDNDRMSDVTESSGEIALDENVLEATEMAYEVGEKESCNSGGLVGDAAEHIEIENKTKDCSEALLFNHSPENIGLTDMSYGAKQTDQNEKESELNSSLRSGIKILACDSSVEDEKEVDEKLVFDPEEVKSTFDTAYVRRVRKQWFETGKKREPSQPPSVFEGEDKTTGMDEDIKTDPIIDEVTKSNLDTAHERRVRKQWFETGRKTETSQPPSIYRGEEKTIRIDEDIKTNPITDKNVDNLAKTHTVEEKETKEVERKEVKKEYLRKVDEANKREREREKDRMAVERAIREARERAFAEARERAERTAVEKATAEVRKRVMAEAREKAEKASAATKSSAEKASMEAKLRSERAAVERATAEARERALEKALSQKATSGVKEQAERCIAEKVSGAFRESGMRQSSSSSDTQKLDESVGESAERCKARLERNQRSMERAAKALAEKNRRDLLAQKEQAERNRFAETLDAEVKRWSSGKEGNLRALLSTLQYVLGPNSGWQSVSLTEIVTTSAVKKAYRRATLHVHPDKLQQRGATIQQKYICEKVFDLLKAAWNKFNSEER
ncbi:auxilin-like protein 1 isoform X1 [Rhododendron vialii]|uniref:auxilin-like protein 1 isoform X1 n=1 Tax=Rhododendron vialii TaxID=182163 RepID=UPI00265EB441|nr:auxilin-like protein 1 isoform X1 [Rhododendron vialii]